MTFARPAIMGIVNVTPDSFSDGGAFSDAQAAIDHGIELARDGASILDVGGESTRPGADEVSVDTELARVLPVIEGLTRETNARISIDTRKPVVATAAIDAGASIWNDVSALSFDVGSIEKAASLDCDIVLMHAQGTPQNMQDQPTYVDPVSEIKAYLSGRVELCVAAGIARNRLIVDLGIGFGKTTAHNVALLSGIKKLMLPGVRMLVGASRKRFIASLDRDGSPSERLGGSLAAALAAARDGADIVRVHDVAETRQALAVSRAIYNT